MALIEKVSQEDLIFYEILKNPVLCTEFINNFDKLEWEEPFELVWYQKEILCDFNDHVSVCTARATGKTVSLVSIITWALVFNLFPEDYIVYTVPSKVHLQPVWTGLVRQFRSNSFLKYMVARNSGFNSSDFRAELLNTAVLICRIAGQTGAGANVIGLHTPFVLLDEGGYYVWGTWVELQPTLNTFTSGYRMMVAGVPTGIRESNVLYTADQEDSSYTKHRLSAFQNPRFTEADEQLALEQYGGKDADDYIHLVLGLHGSPIFALFDRNLMEVSNYPVYKLVIDGISMRESIEDYIEKLALFPSIDSKRPVIMGVDLGYTEPTAIIILYEDTLGRLKFHGRIQLNKVSYSIQDRIIDMLDTKFKPVVIGVDEGSSGKAVIQRLQESQDFINKNYRERMIPVNFSSSIVLGTDVNGEEIKSKTKPFTVSVLQEYSNNHKLVYTSTDLEMITELERMTYTKNTLGDITYRTLTSRGGKRGEDHHTAALLCATFAYYLTNEDLSATRRKAKLFMPRWF